MAKKVILKDLYSELEPDVQRIVKEIFNYCSTELVSGQRMKIDEKIIDLIQYTIETKE